MSQFYQKKDREAGPQEKDGEKKATWFFPQITGKKRIALYGYSALTLLAAIIVVGYVIFELFSAPPVVPGVDTTRPPRPSSELSLDPNNPDIIDNPEVSSDRKVQFYTFLLVGQSQEEGGNLTDTMMLAAYDVPNQTLNVMSLPRDIYVRRNDRRMLLNAVYTWGGGSKGGDKALREEVQELTGIPVDYFVLVKWKAFGELVDAIGGVYYDVPRNMKYSDPEQGLYINVSKGYQLLDGDKAMQVVRFREGANGYIDGDLGRIRTQQGFMKEVIKKCLEPSTLLGNLGEYITIFQENVTTDLDVNALTYFGKSAIGGLDMDNVTFLTLPNKAASNGHLYPDADEILKVVNEGFNPYKEDIKPWELKVEEGSSSGSSSSSSSSSSGSTSTPRPSNTPVDTPKPTESSEPISSRSPSASPSPTPEAPRTSTRPSTQPFESPEGGEEPPESPADEEPPEISTDPTREPDAEESDPPVQMTDTPMLTPPPVPSTEPTPEPTPEELPPEIPDGPVG